MLYSGIMLYGSEITSGYRILIIKIRRGEKERGRARYREEEGNEREKGGNFLLI